MGVFTLLPLDEIEDELRGFWPWNKDRFGVGAVTCCRLLF